MAQVVWYLSSLSNINQTNTLNLSIISGASKRPITAGNFQFHAPVKTRVESGNGELYEAKLIMLKPTAFEMSQNESLIPDGDFCLNVSNSEGYNVTYFSIKQLMEIHITTTTPSVDVSFEE